MDNKDEDNKNLPAVQDGRSNGLKQQRQQERREKVKVMLARHMTQAQMAQTLNTSLRTIADDVAAIRREAAQELAKTSDVLSIAAGVEMRAERRLRELYMLSLAADDIQDLNARLTYKLQVLKEAERQDMSRLAALQKLGIVQQAAKEVVIDMKAAKMLNSIPEAELARALEGDEKQFLDLLSKALGPEAMAELLEGDVSEFTQGRLPAKTGDEELDGF